VALSELFSNTVLVELRLKTGKEKRKKKDINLKYILPKC
jgi:hypothetical protein